MHKVTGQVLCFLLTMLKGLIPSVLNPNLTFLISLENDFLYPKLIALHYDASVGCLTFPSFKRCSACHLISFVVFSFANNLFKNGIIGKYRTTFSGGLLFLSPIIALVDSDRTRIELCIFVMVQYESLMHA